MAVVISAVASDRSRRRTTRTFSVTWNANYANPGPNLLNLATATDPNYSGAGVSGLIDPGDVIAGLYTPKVAEPPINGFINAGVQYNVIVAMNPAATSWANALIMVLENAATGAQLANGTSILGSFLLELTGPNGKF
jgi:hypothetical protein